MNKFVFLITLISGVCVVQATARDYHVDAQHGHDAADGQTPAAAWRSLARAQEADFKPGDRLLLQRGSRFEGGLVLQLEGTEQQPIVIGAYGEGPPPVLDAAGHMAGVLLQDSHHVVVRDLEITADGGETRVGRKDRRYGVLVRAGEGSTSHITLENLTIYRIFPEVGSPHEGRHSETFMGTGISIEGRRNGDCSDMTVRDCRIALTGFKAINLKHLQRVEVLDNQMKDIGGPAIQPGNVDDLLVRGNMVDGSGSDTDPRMHMRGSGIWPWSCNRVLIEKNRFMHARGTGDSCGIHIDFNCRDVVVQYNMSIDNEGGFIEILGNNHNCAYRYNISVNDGARVKGEDKAFQDGKIFWTSGYVGSKRPKSGPFNSYIYNNTIYVGPNSRSCFSIAPSTDGLLVANNIFHIMGESVDVLGDQDKRQDRRVGRIPRTVMRNNFFLTDSVWPASLPVQDEDPIIGKPFFQMPGGTDPVDYIPRHADLVQDRGIAIPKLDGDDIGLRIGLEVEEDILGRPIRGRPDLGAIELSP